MALRVVLVDIDGRGFQAGDGVLDQRAAAAAAALVGMHEQHLDVGVLDAQEGIGDTVIGAQHVQQAFGCHSGQLVAHEGHQEGDIAVVEEIVGGAYGQVPDVEQSGQVGGMCQGNPGNW